jgi:hypothetical protein
MVNLFSSFRGHEKMSESSGTRHCQACSGTAICLLTGNNCGLRDQEIMFEQSKHDSSGPWFAPIQMRQKNARPSFSKMNKTKKETR